MMDWVSGVVIFKRRRVFGIVYKTDDYISIREFIVSFLDDN